MLTLFFAAASALAGYGDASFGIPTAEEREIHMWTNATRGDPAKFESEYVKGGCAFSSFLPLEQAPVNPHLFNYDLAEAARAHSDEMWTNDYFAHTSLDGSSMGTRVWSFYTGWAVAENIAWGTNLGVRYAVQSGWMCSTGHRKTLMATKYKELGVGWAGASGDGGLYATQNFGARVAAVIRPINMGAHVPTTPVTTVDFYADWYSATGAAPTTYQVVYNGKAHTMTAYSGVTAGKKTYTKNLAITAAGCHEYYFKAKVGAVETRFPETGSYGWGTCTWADADAQFVQRQLVAI